MADAMISSYRVALLSTVLLLLLSFDGVVFGSSLSDCRLMTMENTPKYHLDTACDRGHHNDYRDSFNRYATHRKLQNLGPYRVPSQKTVVCPEVPEDLSGSKDSLLGFDIVWLVENKASTPIVVAVVQDGVEYSAYRPSIYPPHSDPLAILQPGQWKSFFTFEGHTFHVREILPDGNLGRVLLQHRAGMIPIQNRYGPPKLWCDPFAPDPEPKLENGRPDPGYARTSPQSKLRKCNVVDIGFRNEVGCPLNVYYTGMQTSNETTGDATCNEKFKFHLGLNWHSNNDWVHDWASNTKYEASYVGHNFVFRLASDPTILVDQHTLQPTIVSDCDQKKSEPLPMESVQMEAFVTTPIGSIKDLPMVIIRNTTNAAAATSNVTTTRPRQKTRDPRSYNHTKFSRRTTSTLFLSGEVAVK